jgi:dTDP-4-dehydrorhamnose 3,5-epimerase
MDKITVQDVFLTPLKQIYHPQGDVYHGIKNSDTGFVGFGEAYFSTILFKEIKPWKKHIKMTLNLVVPVGAIRFVIYDDRLESSTFGSFFDVIIGEKNYQRLTIPPGVWVAFTGASSEKNLLLNVADIEHDPNEVVRKELEEINFQW